jgi:hypothetical protein
MFKVTFDTRGFETAFPGKEIEKEIEKAVNWYINQVYRDLSKQHGRRWTYVTPPGDKRKNVRKRTGKLLNDLKRAKYGRRQGNTWQAGFNIDRGSYLYRFHVGDPGEEETFTRSDVPPNLRYGRGLLIPLRAALNANGTPKPISGRQNLKMARGSLFSTADLAGEDAAKLENSIIVYKQSGRRKIPMYIFAKKFTVPKRVFVREKMIKYYDELYDRLDDEIEKALNRNRL